MNNAISYQTGVDPASIHLRPPKKACAWMPVADWGQRLARARRRGPVPAATTGSLEFWLVECAMRRFSSDVERMLTDFVRAHFRVSRHRILCYRYYASPEPQYREMDIVIGTDQLPAMVVEVKCHTKRDESLLNTAAKSQAMATMDILRQRWPEARSLIVHVETLSLLDPSFAPKRLCPLADLPRRMALRLRNPDPAPSQFLVRGRELLEYSRSRGLFAATYFDRLLSDLARYRQLLKHPSLTGQLTFAVGSLWPNAAQQVSARDNAPNVEGPRETS